MESVNKAIVPLDVALATETKWLSNRNTLIADAENIAAVNSDSDLDVSSAVYTRISKHISALEKFRKSITAPIDDLKKQIMNQEKAFRADLEAHAARIKRMNDAYATTKYDREQAERQAAIDRMAHDGVSAYNAAIDLFGPGVDIVEEGTLIPNARKATVSDGRTVIRWEFEVIDPNQVPREFLSVDETKIRGYRDYQVKIGNIPEIPGVKFTRNVSVESR